MSTGHVLTKEERRLWESRILTILNDVYDSRNKYLMFYLLQQIYEYCVACCTTVENQPIKLKLLQSKYLGDDWSQFCSNLYFIRGITTHAMYLPDNYIYTKIVRVFSDNCIELLLKTFFPDDWEEFDDLRFGYSQYLN